MVGDLQITVTKCEFSQYADGTKKSAEAEDDHIFFLVYVTGKNAGTDSIQFNLGHNWKYNFDLIYDDEYKCTERWYAADKFFRYRDSILPLEECSGIVLIDAMAEAAEGNSSLKLVLKENSIYAEKEYVWTIR